MRSWKTHGLKSQGQLSIDSSGYRNMKLSAGCSGSKLEAKGGIIGGYVQLQIVSEERSLGSDIHVGQENGLYNDLNH